MSIVVHFGKRIFGIIHWIVASIRRMFCCWRKRVNDSESLPFLAGSKNKEGHFLENWESWDGSREKPKSLVETQIEQYRQRLSEEICAPPPAEEPEEDFFQDMQPDYKRTKKILLKQKGNSQQTSSNRFAVQSDIAIIDSFDTSELGVLDERDDGNMHWDVDESLDVDSVLKQAKMKERVERSERHKQLKTEKNKQQHSAAGNSRMPEVVKLS